jgi:hypothetical protein
MTRPQAPSISAIETYVREVATLPNEAAKKERFIGLVGALFPRSSVLGALAGGAEKVVRLDIGRRRIDTYYGNAVIEFEKDLSVSLATAENQLREQVAGIWNDEENPERPLIAIATDALDWRTGGTGEDMYVPLVVCAILSGIR